jgi:UDP-glucose:(heptosyl)LPS alpha-1,3-glucosyltransferase
MLYLERRLFTDPGLKRVIANSRQVQAEIQGHYGVAAPKIRVIHNGLDRQRFHPLPGPEREALARRLGAPPGARIILFVGSGFRRKGLAWLLEAFAGLTDKQAQLWVVGHDSSRRYPELAARLGVADRVKFQGAQVETAPFYQAAAALALPTIYDPCSNVVLEALGCGAPVITTAANGAAEFLTPGVNGTVISRPDDVQALAQALEEFVDLGEEAPTREAAAAAVARLSWESTVQKTLEVLEEALREEEQA